MKYSAALTKKKKINPRNFSLAGFGEVVKQYPFFFLYLMACNKKLRSSCGSYKKKNS